MKKRHLDIYLNDHLAGSVVAIQLLKHVESVYAGNSVAEIVAGVREEVESDRKELERLMKSFEIGESTPRKASAWVAEKLSQLKLFINDPKGGSFRLFEALEALSLGIAGKQSLWQTLSKLADSTPEFRILEYPLLLERAEKQRAQIDSLRLDFALSAFVTGE